MVRIYDDSLSGGTLEFKISDPGTLRYQIDNTASYADASAMDAASGSAELTGSVAAPVGSGTEVIDTSGLAGGLWYIHLVQGATSDSDVVSVSFTKIANTIISVPTGTYTLSGHSPTVTIDVANIPIDVDLGTYTLTGHGPNLTLQRVVSVDAGSYALTGHAPTTSVNRGIAADAGSYALSGNAPIITFNRQIAAAVGSYTLTGHAPTITVAAGTVTISPAAGSYTLTGHAPTITVGGFHPTDLFGVGDDGFYMEFNTTYCFTDSVGGTNCAINDAIAAIEDQSGNGNHFTQATAAARPILTTDGANIYARTDSTDDILNGLALNFTDATLAFLGQSSNTGAVIMIGGATDKLYKTVSGTGSNGYRGARSGDGATRSKSGAYANINFSGMVTSYIADESGTLTMEVNGVTYAGTNTSTTALTNSAIDGTSGIIEVMALFGIDRALTSAEKTDLKTYLDGLPA